MQAGTFAKHQHIAERMMDSNDIERERGITILAKNCSIDYAGHHINIVDTPGHADFGGEVERVLGMVDGVLLLVDAVEGPMPQTRFVTMKALQQGLKPIVVVNKVDRPGARPEWVVNQTFELFDKLGASDDQLDFPVVYASALQRLGDARREGREERRARARTARCSRCSRPSSSACPAPEGDVDGPLQFQVSALDYSSYLGRLGIGRIRRGKLVPGPGGRGAQRARSPTGDAPKKAKIVQVLGFSGLERAPVDSARAGDIVLVTGIDDLSIGTTLAAVDTPEALPPIMVDEPTLSMYFQVNTSPLAGREGKYVTSRNLRERLAKELLTNMALRVEETGDTDAFLVSGRGELHLTILIENMRREGFELAVSRPRVVLREVGGVTCEPYENLSVDVEEAHQGAVMEALGTRRADLTQHGIRQPGPHASRISRAGARPDRLPGRVHEPDARHRPHEPRVRQLCAGEGRHSRAAQRRADVGRGRSRGRVRAVEAAGSRPHVRLARRDAVRRHDHRHPQPRQRPRRQSDQGQAAHQRPRVGHRRSGAPRAADRAHARVRGRVHRRRRARRSDAEVDPHPQAVPQGARAEEGGREAA